MATYEELLKQGYTNSYQQQIEEARKNKPTYTSGRDAQLSDLYDRIVNRQPFTYDMNGDALYQQYKNQYQTLGKQAMKDTMGQAAGLTGGYGSTYSQSVGQQAYNAYLQQLNNIVPDLYDRAYGRYNQETNDLYNLYGMERELENQEYSRFQDTLSDYWTNLSYLQDADKSQYSRQQDYYNRLISLMTQTGYTPTDEDLAAAGMTRAQADSYLAYYKQQQAAAAGGGGGGGGGGRYYGGGGGSYYGGSGSGTNSSASRASTQAEKEAAAPVSVGGMKNTGSSALGMTYNDAYSQLSKINVNVTQFTDPTTGKTYFHNTKTGENYTSPGAGYPMTMQMAQKYARESILKGIMTQAQWSKNKKGYNTYSEYLRAYVQWATS